MLLAVICARTGSIFAAVKREPPALRFFALVTALGICWGSGESFYRDWMGSSKLALLETFFPDLRVPALVLSLTGAVCGLYFLYLGVAVFWRELLGIFRENRTFTEVLRWEWRIYGLMLLVLTVLTVWTFCATDIFYGTEFSQDVVYTSDSASLVRGNVYLALTHSENDLRQPLFAVFAAPFVGWAYLASRLHPGSEAFQAILVNLAQLPLLLAADFLLGKMLELSPGKRVCFLLLTALSYSQLLFVLMMEQYIVAYFWLVLCVYLIWANRRPHRLAVWGAAGTLLTGVVLIPFLSRQVPWKNFRAWFLDMLRYGLEFVGVMLLFCRFDILWSIPGQLGSLGGFTGRELGWAEKGAQYTAFLRSCLIAPQAQAGTNLAGNDSWQLVASSGPDWLGCGVLLLVLASILVNRKKRSTWLLAGWAGFSAVVLFGLGWGTAENGLILYALYFGWPFLGLLFRLLDWVEEKLPIPAAAANLALAALLAAVNIPGILEIVRFGIRRFPL